MARWQDVVMPFGKHKGRKFSDIKKTDTHYLKWMFETFKEGDKLKIAAGEALGYIIKDEKPKFSGESHFKISLRPSEKFMNGTLVIDFSDDYKESFLELHPCCRQWDEANQVWLVPVPILKFILERFKKVKLSKQLWILQKWDNKQYPKTTDP